MTISSRMHSLTSNPNKDMAKNNKTEQGTKEWLAQRKDKMSGSKIPFAFKNQEEKNLLGRSFWV